MIKKPSRKEVRRKKQLRLRSKISGTPQKPRLNVFRSSKHIYAQLIDDVNQVTLASASTVDKDFTLENGGNVEAAKHIGKLIAERAKEQGVTTVVFDRGGYIFHGRVKELAEAAREAGLQF